MSRTSASAALPLRRTPAGRLAPSPPPRRRSGPASPQPGRAAPSRRRAPASGRLARQRLRGAALLDRLLLGRAWVVCVGLLLAGIVFFNVGVLELNRGIAADSQRAAGLKRENDALRLRVARLGSSERIQQAAARNGLVLPAPGQVRYLRAQPTVDARRAASRIEPPAPKPVPPPVSQAPVAPVATPEPQSQTPAASTPPGEAPAPATAPPAGDPAIAPPPAGGGAQAPGPTQAAPAPTPAPTAR